MGTAVRILHSSTLMRTDGAPHAEVERSEPAPSGLNADCGRRDEPDELACWRAKQLAQPADFLLIDGKLVKTRRVGHTTCCRQLQGGASPHTYIAVKILDF